MPRLALVACLCLVAFGDAHGQTVDDTFFERKIRPILVDHCQSCHGEKKQKSGLRLDTLQALLAGGESGPTLVPGKPDESLLVRVIEQGEPYAMPPKGKLPREQVASIRLWVKAGAPWPGGHNRAEQDGNNQLRSQWPDTLVVPIAKAGQPSHGQG